MGRRSRTGTDPRLLRHWVNRGLLVFGIVAAGYFSVVHSLALTLSKGRPALAYQLAPWDGRVVARYAASLIDVPSVSIERGLVDKLARRALELDSTAVDAVSTLGLNSELRNNVDDARRFFAYSEHLSRRDLRTHLWAIEEAVARNDIGGALEHYDYALRTSRFTPRLLYPVLSEAINDHQIVQNLVPILAKQPAWSDSFLEYVAINGQPLASASLFRALNDKQIPFSQLAHKGVIDAFVKKNEFDDAWEHYNLAYGAVDRTSSRDPEFSAATEFPSVFDWQPITDGSGVAATIQSGAFSFSAPATVGGPVLQQFQLLPAGRYYLEGKSAGIEQSSHALPYWSLTCLDNTEVGRLVIPSSNESNGRFFGEFFVPSRCPIQKLTLSIRPSNKIGGVSGQISNVILRPGQSFRRIR